jgi:hypothetical protein
MKKSVLEGTPRHNPYRRFAGRIFYVLATKALRVVNLLSPATYMRLYLPLLRLYGMRFVGKPRHIGRVYFDDLNRIEIGDRTGISDQVVFLTHDYSCTVALRAIGEPLPCDTALVSGIKIGNNVFVGMRTIILPNTQVGDNVIIGAGSVVKGRIPANSVVQGNPAKVVTTIENYATYCSFALASGMGRMGRSNGDVPAVVQS